jgi:hypothetical protein
MAMAQTDGPLARETLGERILFGVDDEIDVALTVQGHIFMAMPGDGGEAHALEQRPQGFGVRGGVFDELESVRAHRVIPWLEFHTRLLYRNTPSIDLPSQHKIANNSHASSF